MDDDSCGSVDNDDEVTVVQNIVSLIKGLFFNINEVAS